MSNTQVERVKIYVKADYTADTTGFGETHFNDLQAAMTYIADQTATALGEDGGVAPAFELVLQDAAYGSTSTGFSFQPSTSTDGYAANVDVLITSDVEDGSTITAKYFLRGNGTSTNKTYLQNVTIGDGVKVDADVSYDYQLYITHNDVVVNSGAEIYAGVIYIANEKKDTNELSVLTINSGAVVSAGYFNIDDSSSKGERAQINVVGNGTEFGDAQLIFNSSISNGKGINTESTVSNGEIEINVKDYGVLSAGSGSSFYLVGGETVTGTTTTEHTAQESINLDHGKIIGQNGAGAYINVGTNASFTMKNASEATVSSVNATAGTVSVSWDSKLIYSSSITVSDSASFTVDFAGFNAEAVTEGETFTIIDGGETGTITGTITATNTELLADAGYGFVVDGSSAYLAEINTSLDALVVNADWAGLANGDTVTVDGTVYKIGLNAFADFDLALDAAKAAELESVTIVNGGDSPYEFVADQGPTWVDTVQNRFQNVLYATAGSSFYTIDASGFTGGLTLVGDFAAKNYTTWDHTDPEFAHYATQSGFSADEANGIWENTWNPGCGVGTNLEIKGNVTIADDSSLTVIGALSTLKVTDGSVNVAGTGELKTSNFGADGQSSVMNLVITEDTDPAAGLYTLKKLANPAAGTLESWFYGSPEVKINVAEGVEIDGIYKVFAFDDSTSRGKAAQLDSIKWTLDQALVDAGYQVNVAPDGVYLATLSGIDVSTLVYDTDFASAKFGDTVQYDGKDYVFGINAFATYGALESGIRNAAGDGSQKITVIMNSDAEKSTFAVGNGYKANVEFVAGKGMTDGVTMTFTGGANSMEANNSSIITIGENVSIKQLGKPDQTNFNLRYISELHIYGSYEWINEGSYGQNWLTNADVTVYNGGQFVWHEGTCWTTFKTLTVQGDGEEFQKDTDGNQIYSWNVARGAESWNTCTGNTITVEDYGAVKLDQLNAVKEVIIDNGWVDLSTTTNNMGFIKGFNTLTVTGESVLNVRGITVGEGATATISATSKINFYQTINGEGTVIIDFADFVAPVGSNIVTIADGAAGTTITAKVEAINATEGWAVAATGSDIVAYNTEAISTDEIYVNSAWSTYTFGNVFESGGITYCYGVNAFANLADATAGADRNQESVTIINAETDSEGAEVAGTIANDATLNFTGLNDVQLSGTFTGTNYKISGDLTVGTGTILNSTSGTVTLNGGASVTMAEGGTFSAANVTVSNGAELALAGGTYGITNALTVKAGGSATISGGTVTALKGITVDCDTKNNIVGSFTVGEDVALSITGSVTVKGDVTLESGSSLTLTGNNTDVTVSSLGVLEVAYDSDLILKRNLTTNDQLYINCTGFAETNLTETEQKNDYAVVVDGSQSGGSKITGGFGMIGGEDLAAAGWAAKTDGKSIFIFDEAYYGTDIYVNSAWAGIGSLGLVEETKYRISVNAYSDYASAMTLGATEVISLSQMTGDVDAKKLAVKFDLEDDQVVNANSVALDALDAKEDIVTVDQLTLSNEGDAKISYIKELNLGDGADGDAALTIADGDVLYVNQLVVKEAAVLSGDLLFTGSNAALKIESGATLTMTWDQFMVIEGVEIIGASGSVIISDLGTKKLTATQISNLQDMYGDIIAGLDTAKVVLDNMKDLSDLLNEDGQSIYAGDVSGTNSSDKLAVDKGATADYSGIDYNMRGGKNTVTINQDADFAIGDLKNVSTIDVKAGSKNGKTVADFGAITAAAGNTTVKVGNNVDFTAAGIEPSDLGGSSTISFGNNVTAVITGTEDAYGYIYGVKGVTVGKDSSLNVKGGDIKSYDDVPAATLKVGNGSTLDLEDADYDVIGSINGIETITFGNETKAKVLDIIDAKNITFGKDSELIAHDIDGTALKAGDGSKISVSGDVDMSTVTFGKNVITEITGDLDDVKSLTLGAANEFSVKSIDGTIANSTIKAGDGSIVEIDENVNMRGGKNSITTGKGSDWAIGGDVKNVNTLTATAAGNWVWNEDKTTYTMQQTELSIDGDFIAGEGAATLTFGNYSIVNIGGGIQESDLGSTLKITVGSNANVVISEFSAITGLNNLTISNGVDYKTYSLNEAGKAVADADKAEGTTIFTAGKVIGTEKNDTIKVGNKADVNLGNVFMGEGNDTINIGKDSAFTAGIVDLSAGKNTVVIGAGSEMSAVKMNGVNKLTVTGELEAGDITGTDDFADVVTFNGVAEVGSIDLGTDAKGKMNDKLVIGKEAEVVINGGISNVEALTIGKDAVVAANEATLADILDFKDVKGSKIDASASFISLDDVAGGTSSDAIYDAGFNAVLGATIEGTGDEEYDTADCFALGTGTDLTGWSISGEGIKVDVYTTTDNGATWTATEVIADENGDFKLGNYTEGVKVAVSLDLEEGEEAAITKYSVTKLA